MTALISDDNLRIFCNEIGSVGMMARELKERRERESDAGKLLIELSPYVDSIICYASTTAEYDGNRVAKAFAYWKAKYDTR